MSKFKKLFETCQLSFSAEIDPSAPSSDLSSNSEPSDPSPHQSASPRKAAFGSLPRQVNIQPAKLIRRPDHHPEPAQEATSRGSNPKGSEPTLPRHPKRLSAQAYKLADPPKAPKSSQSASKRSDPNYKPVTAYIRKETHQQVRIALLQQGDQTFSDLIEALLVEWLGKRDLNS